MRIRKALPALVVAVLILSAGSLIHPFGRLDRNVRDAPMLSGSSINPETLHLIERACQDCHSSNTRVPLYARVAPMSWTIERDVALGRSRLNLSRWREYSEAERIRLLSEMGSAVRNRAMPAPSYLLLHREARLSDEERERIYRWTRAERSRLRLRKTPHAP